MGPALLKGASVSVRTVLFIDYQNAYRGAREAFHRPNDRSNLGQLDPASIGALLVSRRQDRVLTQVRVYWGRPDAVLDPVGHGANLRQTSSWESAGVTAITRPLRYPRGWLGVEDYEAVADPTDYKKPKGAMLAAPNSRAGRR